MNAFITSLNRIAEGFLTSYAWPVLWQTALLAVIITVASWTFFRKASPQFRYLLWLLVLVRLALPPAAYLPTGIGNWGRALLDLLPSLVHQEQVVGKAESASPAPILFQVPDAAISEYETVPRDVAAAPTQPPAVSLSKHALLLLAWAVGIAGLLSFLLIRLIRFHYLLRGAALPGEALSRSVADYARRLGMRRDVKVRVTDAPCGPIVCGFFRPVIVLPRRILLELSQEELAPVLIHELAHVKRGDWLVNWLQVLSGILYFFHPFLWYANRQIRQEREKACDDLVLVTVRLDRKGYVNSLMRVRDRVEGRMGLLPALVGIVEHRSSLSARILRILDPRTRPSAKLSFLSILTLIAFACCFLTFTAKPQASGQATPADSTESQPPSAESRLPSRQSRDVAPAAPAKTISGIVKDAEGRPVENADVLLTGDNLEYYGSVSMGSMKTLPDGMFTQIGSMKTGADGAFAFTASLPVRADRAYQIIASKPGHAWAGVRMNSTKVVEISNPVQLTLGEPKPLAGQVVNRKGEPVSGALVYPLDILDKRSAYSGRTVLRFTFPGMERFAVKTDAAGRFRFEQLPADWQPGVLVRHPDYANLSVLPDEKSPIRAGQEDVRLELAAPSRIQGRVMDTATSRPVEGVVLVAVDLFAGNLPLSIAATGADGRYEFPNLAAGVYYSIGPLSDFEFGDKTRASEGIVRSRCPVPLKEGEVLDGMDLPRSPGVLVHGRVVNKETLKGIPCMEVGVSQNEADMDGPNWHSRIYTDSEGRFEVTAPEGSVEVKALPVAAHVDDLRYSQVLKLKKGRIPEEVVIALPAIPPLRVKGTVRGPDGGPFAGRATIVPGVGNVPGPIYTDDTGQFSFEIRRPVDLPSAPDMPPDLTLYALVPEKNLAGRVPLYSRSEEAEVWVRLRAGGIVIGRVVDEGKKPIPEARITLHPTATASCGYDVIADADGRFRIPSLCDQVEYQMELTSQGYGRTQIRGIKGAAGQTHDCGDIVLAKGSSGASAARGSGQENPPNSAESRQPSGEGRDAAPSTPEKRNILGVVKDAKGQPVENAEFLLFRFLIRDFTGAPLGSTKTNAEGNFAFDPPQAPEKRGVAYLLVASKPGYAWGGYGTDAKMARERGPITLTLGEPKPLAGQVVNGKGEPVSGAVVYPLITSSDNMKTILVLPGMERLAAKTDAAGRFRFEQIPAGWKAGFLVRHPDYANLGTSSVLWDMVFDAGKEDIRLELAAAGTIRGRLIDAATDRPVKGVTLLAQDRHTGSSSMATTGADGRYGIKNLPPGNYTIAPSSQSGTETKNAEGMVQPLSGLKLKEGQTLDGINLSMKPGILVRGRAINEKTKKGLPGVFVEVCLQGTFGNAWSADVQTDAEGQFKITAPEGTITLRAYCKEYRQISEIMGQTVTLKQGETPGEVVIAFQSAPALWISGVVLDPGGKPVEGAIVRPGFDIYRKDTRTDAAGGFSLNITRNTTERSAPEDMTLYTLAPGKNLAAMVPIEGDQKEINLRIQLKAGGAITGRVLDEEKKPIAKAKTHLRRPIIYAHNLRIVDLGEPAAVDADGRFRVSSLSEGVEYYLDIMAEGYGREWITEIRSVAGQTMDRGDITLLRADVYVDVSVMDPSGSPIEGAGLYAQGIKQPYSSPVVTGKDGKLHLGPFVASDLEIDVDKEGYSHGMANLTLTKGKNEEVRIEMSDKTGAAGPDREKSDKETAARPANAQAKVMLDQTAEEYQAQLGDETRRKEAEEKEKAAQKKLNMPISLSTDVPVPLREFRKSLELLSGLNIYVAQGGEAMINVTFVDKPLHEVLDTILIPIGLKWSRKGNVITITADPIKTKVFQLGVEEAAKVGTLMKDQTLQKVLWGEEGKPPRSDTFLQLKEGSNLLVIHDSEQNIKKLEKFLAAYKKGVPREIVTRIYKIRKEKGDEIKSRIEAILRTDQISPLVSERRVYLVNESLIVRAAPDEHVKVEELLNDKAMLAGLKEDELSVATFVIEPREDLLKSPELSKGFFNRVVEVIEVMLYAKEGKEKAGAEGRWMRVDRATGQVTVTDYPERLRNISDYLQSLPQLKQKERREYIFLKYRAANEKTLAEIEEALGMKPRSIQTSESGGASGAGPPGAGVGEPAPGGKQEKPFSISRFGKQNAIVVTYTDPRDLARVQEVIAKLDRPEVQVEVETLILDVSPKAPVEVRREMEKYLTPDSKIRAAIRSSPSKTSGTLVTTDSKIHATIRSSSSKTSGTLGESDSKIRAAIRSSSSKTSGTLGESAAPTATFLHFWESADPKLREWEKNGYLSVRTGPHILVADKALAAFKMAEKPSLQPAAFSLEEKPSPVASTASNTASNIAPKTAPKTLLSLEFRPKVEADKRILFQDVRLEAGSAEAYTAEFKPSLLMDEKQYVVLGRLRPQADETPSCYVLMKAQLIE